MTQHVADVVRFRNAEAPFTELFSLLKRYDLQSEKIPMLAYSAEELKTMHQHVENAMDVLLQGLQSVGYLLGTSLLDNKNATHKLSDIGFFITTIGNLTEALNVLRSDADSELKQRGIQDY